MAMFARNFTRSRHLIQLIRSGQRTIEASVATPYFHELKPGDRVNVVSQRDGDLELVCEIVEKQHFKTVGELIAAVGVERIVGAGKTPKSGGRGGGEENEILLRGGASPNAVARQGVFAFHLKVVEDLFSELEEEHEHRVFHLQDLQQIADGTKKIDARLMLLKRRIVCPGERIVFNYKDPKTSVKWQLTCEAIATKHYATFRELLATEGVERCVPGCGDIEKAINACHEQYHQQGHKSRRSEIERGVVAIHLKPISSLKKVVDASGEEKK